MTTCTRRVEFDAGHRVDGHESKCARLHGHRYAIEITASAPELDSVGRVIDFGVLKGVVGKWIDENWDHRMLLWHGDCTLDEEPGVVRVPFNPTAENMAVFLLEKANELLIDYSVTVVGIRVWETPNCWADAWR